MNTKDPETTFYRVLFRILKTWQEAYPDDRISDHLALVVAQINEKKQPKIAQAFKNLLTPPAEQETTTKKETKSDE